MNNLPEGSPPRWSGAFPIGVGVAALVVLIGGLGVWSVTARLTGAVVTSGLIEVESNRQVVQHPDGGVVGAIYVKESDEVAEGDILLRIDGRQLQSGLTIIEGQLREISARQSRLRAERDGDQEISFDEDILELIEVDSASRQQVEVARELFNARREALAQESDLLREQNLQIDNRIEGAQAQLDALADQAVLLDDELDDLKELLRQKLTQASQVSALEREKARLEGQAGRLKAEQAELRGQGASNKISLLQLTTKRREEAVTMLRDLQYRKIELTERQIELADTLSRLEVRAPVSGIIYNLQVFSPQAVVRPAEPLMYIIPQDRPLVVSARINAIDIADVFVGQDVALRFPALDQRTTPEIMGKIGRVSADVLQDEATGATYYTTEILPLENEILKLGDQTLLPGMPVEAFIQTGDRTPLSFLVSPLTNFFDGAFRE